jgi:peroxiredoxin
MNNTPETDELIRSLTYEQLASTESCYAQMREHARNLERDRNEQCRLLGMSAERESALRGEIERERCLADRLGDALLSTLSCWITSPDAEQAAKSLAAWKEARSE